MKHVITDIRQLFVLIEHLKLVDNPMLFHERDSQTGGHLGTRQD